MVGNLSGAIERTVPYWAIWPAGDGAIIIRNPLENY
jgi:hypothetical protein